MKKNTILIACVTLLAFSLSTIPVGHSQAASTAHPTPKPPKPPKPTTPVKPPTPTPKPTKTPKPTPTPKPTKTPKPTPTPKPTKTPKPTPTPTQQQLFDADHKTVQGLVDDIKKNPANAAADQAMINTLVTNDLNIAMAEITFAMNHGGKQDHIDTANNELAQAQAKVLSDPADAINHAKNAWQQAMQSLP
jgi:outer membrane biosynthesis protein TonB